MEYEYYLHKFPEPTPEYKRFMRDYITERAMIAGRGEEDVTIWNKLRGDELEAAKNFIFDHLKENPKTPYIRAVSFFKDKRAIPILLNIINLYTNEFIVEKLLAAKVLHDWIGYEDYIPMLEATCKNHADKDLHNYLKLSINQFIDGLRETEKERIMKALNMSN